MSVRGSVAEWWKEGMMSVGTQNQKKLECLLNDWLDANWRQE